MPATTNVNFRTVVHEKSSGMVMFFPDVCKTPAPPAGPIPIPYPNIAQSSDTDKGSKEVKIDGCPIMLKDSCFKTSTGDEAGSAGGIMSSSTKGKAEFLNYSFDVKIEGKNVPRLADMMLGNKQSSPNTPPMPEIQAPMVMIPAIETEETEDIQLDKLEETDSDAEDSIENTGSGARSLDSGAKPDKKPAKQDEKEEEPPVPTIKAKWSKKEIHPLHNKNETPSSPPTDDIPDECKVKLEVDTTDVPDGTAATIEIRHALTGAVVKNGAFRALVVKGNKVVDSKTNSPVEWTMDAESKLWDPWDKPFYFFKVTVDYLDLKVETPKDFKAKEAECLRLVYWSACVSDKVADDNLSNPLHTQDEMRVIASILESNPNHKVMKRVFKASDISSEDGFKGLWGSIIRNSYVYHYGGHGGVQCATNQKEYFKCEPETKIPTRCPEEGGENHKGRGATIFLEKYALTGDWLAEKPINPSVPKYLAYFNSCQTGWESSLCDAFVKRGTWNVIAFKRNIGDTACVNLAMDFYDVWINTHSADPRKIPTVFFDVSASCYTSLRPVLYGKGGGAIPDPQALSALEIAGIDIGATSTGILLGIAAAELVKSP